MSSWISVVWSSKFFSKSRITLGGQWCDPAMWLTFQFRIWLGSFLNRMVTSLRDCGRNILLQPIALNVSKPVNEVELELHYSVCTIVLTDLDMQIYIGPTGPVISLIWGLGPPLQDTGGQWMQNHPGPMYPWFANQRTEDICDNLKSQVVSKVIWRANKGVEWECNHHVPTWAWHGHVEIKNMSKSQSMRESWVHVLEVLIFPWV